MYNYEYCDLNFFNTKSTLFLCAKNQDCAFLPEHKLFSSCAQQQFLPPNFLKFSAEKHLQKFSAVWYIYNILLTYNWFEENEERDQEMKFFTSIRKVLQLQYATKRVIANHFHQKHFNKKCINSKIMPTV